MSPGTNEDRVRVSVEVNGIQAERYVEPRMLLVDLLRDELGLTGAHIGCEEGICGACTVEVDGRIVKSCLMFAVQADGCRITTVEGVEGPDGSLHPVQEAFWECHAVQCGYCTPGMVMSARALLAEHPEPGDDEIKECLNGNLCRCTGYQNILAGVRKAGELLKAEGSA